MIIRSDWRQESKKQERRRREKGDERRKAREELALAFERVDEAGRQNGEPGGRHAHACLPFSFSHQEQNRTNSFITAFRRNGCDARACDVFLKEEEEKGPETHPVVLKPLFVQ